jgi:hypothetical protein
MTDLVDCWVQALDLIQSWGETFLPQSSRMPLFAQTYHELRRDGLPFRRQYDASKVPVLTPPATVRKRAPAEDDMLRMVETSSTMLRDFMHNAATAEELADNDIFQEVGGFVPQSC